MAGNSGTPPQAQPAWFSGFALQLSSISNDMKMLNQKMIEIARASEFALEKAQEAEVKASNAEKCVGELRADNCKLHAKVNDLQQRIINLELQSRRNNLIFCGIAEKDNEKWEECENAVCEFLRSIGVNEVKFERVHRLGQKIPKKPRNIIVKFCFFKDREKVWNSRFELSKTNVWLMEDFPAEIIQKRKALYPAMKAAQRSTEIKNASLQVDKLILDGKAFTTHNMHELPGFLQPEKAAVIETDDTMVFYTRHAIFSNLHSTEIRVDGEKFCCNEQYFHFMKANMFKDEVTAAKIKAETDPYKMISLGRQVKGYRHQKWMQEAKGVLKRANEAKYRQNKTARDALLSTGSKMLGEASANKIYGTGVGLFSKKATDVSAWEGQNLMGKILTEIRDEIVESA